MVDLSGRRARYPIALLLSVILFCLGVVGGGAQQATPVSGDDGEAARPAMLTVLDEGEPEEPMATLVIHVYDVVDGDHQPVAGACVLAEHESGTKTELCDGRDDGTPDGTITFLLPQGNYVVVVSQPPQGYAIGPAIPQFLTTNLTATIDYQLIPGGRSLFVNAVDDQQQPVAGGCVSIFVDDGSGHPGELVSAACDSANGEPADGSIAFRGIVSGDYIAVQSTVPEGHAPAAAVPFVVSGDGTGPIVVTMVNGVVNTSGDLNVVMADASGTPIAGGCVDVHVDAGGGDAGELLAHQCDADDGDSDGKLLFTELDPGSYVIVERLAPDGYMLADATIGEVAEDAATTVTVKHTPGGSDVTVRTVDVNSGAVIRGACIAVVEDDGSDPTQKEPLAERCDDADGNSDGLIVFAGLPAGSYALWERVAPETYKAVEASIPFSVDGVADATITVENTPLTLVEQLVEVLIEILDEILNG